MPVLTELERELLDMLQRLEAAQATLDRKRKLGHVYSGPYDFVLAHGEFQRPVRHGYRQGRPRACFGNAINMAAIHGLRYVEGYAANVHTRGDAIHHAWNLDAAGDVVDVTWGLFNRGRLVDPLDAAYRGVVFSVERADDATWHGDASVLDDSRRGWPLFRARWQGETVGAWRESVRLKAVRAHRDGRIEEALKLYEEMEREAGADVRRV